MLFVVSVLLVSSCYLSCYFTDRKPTWLFLLAIATEHHLNLSGNYYDSNWLHGFYIRTELAAVACALTAGTLLAGEMLRRLSECIALVAVTFVGIFGVILLWNASPTDYHHLLMIRLALWAGLVLELATAELIAWHGRRESSRDARMVLCYAGLVTAFSGTNYLHSGDWESDRLRFQLLAMGIFTLWAGVDVAKHHGFRAGVCYPAGIESNAR